MPINIAEVCKVKYPGEVEKLNITFQKNEFDIRLVTWNVPDTPRPTEAELLKQAPMYEDAYNLMMFMQDGDELVQFHVDEVAQSRQYNNGVSCASYTQSTNPVWAAEAQTFIAWRDSMYIYALQVFSDIQAGEPVPTQEEFVAGFPMIVWP